MSVSFIKEFLAFDKIIAVGGSFMMKGDIEANISANDNDWAGMLYDGENYCFSKNYHLHIVDRVGGDGSGRGQR